MMLFTLNRRVKVCLRVLQFTAKICARYLNLEIMLKLFKEGATGTITSVKGHVVTVLPDKSINTFDVLADHVEENSEVAYSRVPPRSVSIPNVRPLPPPKKGNVYGDVRSASIANFRRPPSPQKKGYDFGRARRDPLLNARINIRQGLHNGMVGRVVEVRGHRVRVELGAQMNHAYVD
ncbi:hypothetical protein P3S68_026916 [Capsicum galapagoense]